MVYCMAVVTFVHVDHHYSWIARLTKCPANDYFLNRRSQRCCRLERLYYPILVAVAVVVVDLCLNCPSMVYRLSLILVQQHVVVNWLTITKDKVLVKRGFMKIGKSFVCEIFWRNYQTVGPSIILVVLDLKNLQIGKFGWILFKVTMLKWASLVCICSA